MQRSAAIDAPHDPASKTQGYPGTYHTQGMPEQPDITRDGSILQNGRVHKVFGHMGGRTGHKSDQVIRENPASRGTGTSAEGLVGPPGRGWCRTPVNSSGTRLTLTLGGGPREVHPPAR